MRQVRGGGVDERAYVKVEKFVVCVALMMLLSIFKHNFICIIYHRQFVSIIIIMIG